MAESVIVMSKQANRLDNSLKQKAYTFLEKLGANDETLGLHIEPIKRAIDPRVRTGRVDRQYRAVLFRLDNDGQRYYVVHGIYNHDEAIGIALQTRLTLNPVNGMPNFDVVEQTATPAYPAGAREPEEGTPAPRAEGSPADIPAPSSAPDPRAEKRSLMITASAAELEKGLGFSPELAARAIALPDEDSLLALAEEIEGWRAMALIDLGTGRSIEQIREDLGLNVRRTGVEDTDEAIVEGLQAPAARMEFAVIEGADELRAVIDGGDFGAWRIFLHPTQRHHVERRGRGSFRLAGGAGTGKTVVVLHRARWLLERNGCARVIVTTFTRNLADELNRGLRSLNPRLSPARGLGRPGAYVSGIDALASMVLRSADDKIGRAHV